MQRPQAGDLRCQCGVIGIEIGRAAPRDLLHIGFGSNRIERLSVKGRDRTQPGGRLPRIERAAGWIAVEIDHGARHAAVHDCRPQIGGEGIEPVNMMIRVAPRQIV